MDQKVVKKLRVASKSHLQICTFVVGQWEKWIREQRASYSNFNWFNYLFSDEEPSMITREGGDWTRSVCLLHIKQCSQNRTQSYQRLLQCSLYVRQHYSILLVIEFGRAREAHFWSGWKNIIFPVHWGDIGDLPLLIRSSIGWWKCRRAAVWGKLNHSIVTVSGRTLMIKIDSTHQSRTSISPFLSSFPSLSILCKCVFLWISV